MNQKIFTPPPSEFLSNIHDGDQHQFILWGEHEWRHIAAEGSCLTSRSIFFISEKNAQHATMDESKVKHTKDKMKLSYDKTSGPDPYHCQCIPISVSVCVHLDGLFTLI